jgi:hypothetical protein
MCDGVPEFIVILVIFNDIMQLQQCDRIYQR